MKGRRTMENAWDKIVKALAAAGGAVAGLFGGMDAMLVVLVVFMATDYLSGLTAGWMGKSPKTATGRLDSKVGFIGILKKALILLVVLMAATLDRIMPTDMAVFRNMIVFFYIANEGLSILENLALCGVPFPGVLKTALEKIRDKNDRAEDDPEAERETGEADEREENEVEM